MSKLASYEQILLSAARVLGRPNSAKWKIFHLVNGKLTGPEIAKKLKMKAATNCANDLTELHNKGLIEPIAKIGNATIYQKIPELRNVNLKPYTKRRQPVIQTASPPTSANSSSSAPVLFSQAIDKVVALGRVYGIDNIDRNWIDALVILNFIETTLTKFLMDHGYTDAQLEGIHWDEKAKKVENKLQEEARLAGTKPRRIAINNLANYRTNRNLLDHQAHLSEARIKPQEVRLFSQLLQALIKEIFDEHATYCQLP